MASSHTMTCDVRRSGRRPLTNRHRSVSFEVLIASTGHRPLTPTVLGSVYDQRSGWSVRRTADARANRDRVSDGNCYLQGCLDRRGDKRVVDACGWHA